METPYVDLHCHPAMKPYGQSFDQTPKGANSSDPKKKNSLWYYDPPSLADKILNFIGGLTKFSQANTTALSYGRVNIVCVSIYPIEKGFVNNRLGTGAIADVLDNFAMGVGENRINFIQQITDYFADLNGEYDFYRQLHNVEVHTDTDTCRYVLTKNYSEIEGYLTQDTLNGKNTVCLVFTIEGMHVLNTGLGANPDESAVLANLAKIKEWEYRPFFVTLAHHFWNNLCGHAKSLAGIVAMAADQSEEIDTGFTPLGWKVVDGLLDNNNRRRILVDIKHMSALSRTQYLQRLKDNYPGQQIPIIMSHAAANGYRSMREKIIDLPETGNKLLHEDINFYDEEIIAMARSGGIMGFQLDERRIANQETLHSTPHSLFRNKIMHYRSGLLWNQVQHVAELLDAKGLPAWDNMAIGSDFDGIIDPLNAFWTAEEMPFLADHLERHAFNFMQGTGKQELRTINQISPHEIITRIFSDNATRFMKTWFV